MAFRSLRLCLSVCDLSTDDGFLFSQAVQILLALIHCALGVLCDRLFVREEKTQNAGVVPVLVIVVYSLSTAPFVSKPWYFFLFQFTSFSNVSSEFLMRSSNGLKTQSLTLRSSFSCGNSLNKMEGGMGARVGRVHSGKAFCCLFHV